MLKTFNDTDCKENDLVFQQSRPAFQLIGLDMADTDIVSLEKPGDLKVGSVLYVYKHTAIRYHRTYLSLIS